MKVIIIILLFSIVCFGQYGNELIQTGDAETFTGTVDDGNTDTWTGWTNQNAGTAGLHEATATANSGSYAVKITTDDNVSIRMFDNEINLTSGDSIRARIYTRGDGTNSLRYRMHNGTAWFAAMVEPGITGTSYIEHIFDFVSNNTNVNWAIYLFGDDTDGAITYWDDLTWRIVLDTLYTDPSMADETDNDSTKTLTEAFETRGSHSGGNFITIAGTYSESITMDSSFTKWEASGAAIVTSVDFNSVTCIVDEQYLTILTKLNDGNVTYINTPVTDIGFPGFPGFPGWGGFK